VETFAFVLFAVVAAALVVGLVTLAGRERAYEQIGRGGLALDRDGAEGGAGPSGPRLPPAEPSLEDEVRELVERRNARRVREGQAPLDVEAEVARQLRELSGG
jgi:hypothetical protein